MDENLVGYLLDALDPDERRQVEDRLRGDANARRRLQRLKELVQPLAADLDPIDPPPGLWVRALARVAEHRCRPLPEAPPVLKSRAPAPRGWWRRADLLVAASILLVLGLLLPPTLYYLRYRGNVLACQNNLRVFYAALQDYSERHHGDFPNVATAAPPPRNVPGMFVVALHDDGLLGDDTGMDCPSQGRALLYRPSRTEVETMPPERFQQCAVRMAGCYAYSLGYLDPLGRVRGLRRPGQPAAVPILADRPPEGVARGDLGNSPNHAGRGQNVLYTDGHCVFHTGRAVGLGGDDIYLNQDQKVAAGKNQNDTVLATGDALP